MQRRFRERMAGLFELPGDVMMNVSRITLVGGAQMLLENHRGLVAYNPSSITFDLPDGAVTIEGEELSIGTISAEEVTVSGRIVVLRFQQGGA